jgi:hypothetical protein
MVRDTIRTTNRLSRLIRGGATPRCCLRCGRRVAHGDEHVVRIHGDLLHAGCALYRPRGGG